MTEKIRKELFRLSDEGYKDFLSGLIPTVDPDAIIGVRTPELRQYAKELYKQGDYTEFLIDLPHLYFDENQLHAFIISCMRDFDECICELERFLPYIDNWATCDQLSPKVFAKHKYKLLKPIHSWMATDETYTVRFAIGMLMQHFLDADFDQKYANAVASVISDEYYVNMMRAWYFATALAKQYDCIIKYLEELKLDVWTHNMTIKKAVESRRISDEKKSHLRKLKR